MLSIGLVRPGEVKSLQRALIALGYDLGEDGVFNNGVDGDFGPTTEEVVKQFQRDRGMVGVEVDGIVGQATYVELVRALADQPPLVVPKKKETLSTQGFVLETAKEILQKPSTKKQIKRETRKLDNPEIMNTLPPDLTKRNTFLTLTCNLDGANVFIDGNLIGQTPIPKKLLVNPGWHRVRIIDPNAPPSQFSMALPDYQDIYVPKGRTQKIRINLAIPEQESAD
jgi:peptidoglycan hydrolase-like protein with peptidoglycan-binding domain